MSWIKKYAPFLFIFIFTILLLEIASYAAWTTFRKSDMNKSGRAFVSHILNESNETTTIVSNPYTLYWNNPNYTDYEYGKIYNSLGYRSDELENYPENATKILALGGSTTNVWPFVKDNSRIWTSLTEAKLSEAFKTNFQVINAGLPYGTTAELLSHYIFSGKYLKPEYVIYHGGGNDMMPLFFPNYKTDYSHVRWSEAGVRVRKKFKFLIGKSYFAKLITSFAFLYSPYNGSPPFVSLDPKSVLERVKNVDALAFKENLETLVNEAKRNESKVFLIGFLQARKENLTKNHPDFIGIEQAAIDGVKKHDAIMLEIAKKHEHVEFLKLDQSKFKDEWFLDNCHLNEQGEMEKANQISSFLVRKLNE